jgi:hypothetical protein
MGRPIFRLDGGNTYHKLNGGFSEPDARLPHDQRHASAEVEPKLS